MKIAVASDHGGYELKEEIVKYLKEKGYDFIDFGCFSPESVDYPVMAAKACRAIQKGECDRGIICCGTGLGISMAANKFKGIRAAACSDYYSAKYTRLHNEANILSLGGRVLGPGLVIEMVEVFLNTEYLGGRHQRRVDMITAIENGEFPED